MSTTDKVERCQPCPCNNGNILITECSPDHPYARDSQTWYKGKIDCETCIKKYKLDDIKNQDGRFIILKPLGENEDIIHLQKIDDFCRGLT